MSEFPEFTHNREDRPEHELSGISSAFVIGWLWGSAKCPLNSSLAS